MKKVLIIVLLMTCLLVLVGCDPPMKGIDEDEVLANTVKIELVQYENANPKLVRIDGKEPPFFDFSKVTLIATLDDSRMEDVIKDIAKDSLTFYDLAINEPIGKTLILYQRDGKMIVLCGCVYTPEKGFTKYYGDCTVFDKNGEFVEYIGRIGSDYVEMLESLYFESNA